uniref:Transmembrane protein 41B n=1 Tax=Acrobeloides nanus TaxID=290746 RepID=A0A914CVI4_9BILA
MKPSEKQHFKYPRSIDDAKKLGKVLSRYKEQHFYTVLSGITAVYIMLQSFAIPGSIFLTILSGYLFPFSIALTLVCVCSACGAAVCYYLSYLVGRKLVMKYFPDRISKWQNEVQKQRENLLNYIIFLRVTPILPNWFINIASPVIDVPIKPFFFGTLLGVAPPSFLFIQAGTTLQMMTDANAVWSWSSVAILAFFALLSLAPVFYKRYKLKVE